MSCEYTYSTKENENNIYVFEMKITYNDNTIIKKRLISDLTCGKLLEVKNDIKKLKISLCIVNNDKLPEYIIIKKHLNNNIDDYLKYLNENLLITLINQDSIISINYNIL